MAANSDIPVKLFETRQDWENWLTDHYNDPGVWFKFARKGSGLKTPSYAEILETALSFGWIDSQRLAFDEKYYLQKFTPRRPGSIWSRVNRDKAVELIKAGRMKP